MPGACSFQHTGSGLLLPPQNSHALHLQSAQWVLCFLSSLHQVAHRASVLSSAVCGTHGDGAAGIASLLPGTMGSHVTLTEQLLDFFPWCRPAATVCRLPYSNDSLPATNDASHPILNCVRPMVHVAD